MRQVNLFLWTCISKHLRVAQATYSRHCLQIGRAWGYVGSQHLSTFSARLSVGAFRDLGLCVHADHNVRAKPQWPVPIHIKCSPNSILSSLTHSAVWCGGNCWATSWLSKLNLVNVQSPQSPPPTPPLASPMTGSLINANVVGGQARNWHSRERGPPAEL